MPNTTTYRLEAFDIETGKKVIEWPKVASLARFTEGTTIIEAGKYWRVEKVTEMTTQRWRVMVKCEKGRCSTDRSTDSSHELTR
jgi:hypothetical protein